MTSTREGFPVVIPEALYWGNLVVSSNVSSIHEILENGKIGQLYNTTNELINILNKFMVNEKLLKEKVILSIDKAEKEYNWNSIIARLSAKINEISNK
jgi:glycosyltransferase involved in cell wall biosynthesis